MPAGGLDCTHRDNLRELLKSALTVFRERSPQYGHWPADSRALTAVHSGQSGSENRDALPRGPDRREAVEESRHASPLDRKAARILHSRPLCDEYPPRLCRQHASHRPLPLRRHLGTPRTRMRLAPDPPHTGELPSATAPSSHRATKTETQCSNFVSGLEAPRAISSCRRPHSRTRRHHAQHKPRQQHEQMFRDP